MIRVRRIGSWIRRKCLCESSINRGTSNYKRICKSEIVKIKIKCLELHSLPPWQLWSKLLFFTLRSQTSRAWRSRLAANSQKIKMIQVAKEARFVSGLKKKGNVRDAMWRINSRKRKTRKNPKKTKKGSDRKRRWTVALVKTTRIADDSLKRLWLHSTNASKPMWERVLPLMSPAREPSVEVVDF